MFCPECGESDQERNSYCRRCGGFITVSEYNHPFEFGGNTPEKQIGTSLVLNIAIGVLSFALSIAMFTTLSNKPETYAVVYLAAVFLNLVGFLQIINLTIAIKLKKRFKQTKNGRKNIPETENVGEIPPVMIKEFLRDADQKDIVPNSVTETTTKELWQKVNR